jgi:hypothetical protein
MTGDKVETFDGACACGGIAFRMQSKPMFVHCCHCRWCQRETGSAFVLNAFIESNRVTLLKGQVTEIEIPSQSGMGQIIARCPKCLIAVWSHYGGERRLSMVRVGTLENPHYMPPDIHIFTESKQPWVALADGVPALPQYYRRSQYWPVESLSRREIMLKNAI